MAEPALPIATRVFTVSPDEDSGGGSWASQPKWPPHVFLLDTETTTDPTQRLQFGVSRFGSWTEHGTLRIAQEIIFHADDLGERDPEGLKRLRLYVLRHNRLRTAGRPRLELMSRRKWMAKSFLKAAYATEDPALVVGFNLPFDLSRIAVHAGKARMKFLGGFTLMLRKWYDASSGQGRESRFTPRFRFRTLDSKRALMGFGIPRPPYDHALHAGCLLDLRTLAFALTGQSHSLASACETFGVEHGKVEAEAHGRITDSYIDYCRRDVLATQELLLALRQEFDRHPIDVRPYSTFSPASLAKGYLQAMGIRPPAQKFAGLTPDVVGHCMAAYFGGRAEVRIRHELVPVIHTDFLSMYPTINANMKLWDVLTAKDLHVEDATEDVRALLEDVSLEDCLDRELWPQLRFFACIDPADDILPVRAEYGAHSEGLNIGVNELTGGPPLWYAGPDLTAGALLSGHAPTILEAFRLVPKGKQKGLRSVKLRGAARIDPAKEDFFRRVIEERKALGGQSLPDEERDRLDLFLKILANSGSYGIYAELNRLRYAESNPQKVRVFGDGEPFWHSTMTPEKPGHYCFPPLAALTTAGARLMLAMLERMVTDLGGTYAFCDTDSMAIVATREGGLIPCDGGPHALSDGRAAVLALGSEQVDQIVARLEALKPYDPKLVPGPVLEMEDENFDRGVRRQAWCLGISAKRYALFFLHPDGSLDTFAGDPSEHGLGHLLNPTDPESDSRDWIRETWEYLVRQALGESPDEPVWLDQPAVSRMTISSPELLRPFRTAQKNLPYAEQIKPMNFILSAQTLPFGTPVGVDPIRCSLIAPYTPDASRWMELPWSNKYTGQTHPVTTSRRASPRQAVLKSFRSVLAGYWAHRELKSAGPDGRPCRQLARGLLRRRRFSVAWVRRIGKESNDLEAVERGLISRYEEFLENYGGSERDLWEEAVLPVLNLFPKARIAHETGLSARTIAAIRNRNREPDSHSREKLIRFAKELLAQRPEPRARSVDHAKLRPQ